jgi:hypothetical protein
MSPGCRIRISRPVAQAHAGPTVHTSYLRVTLARPLVHSQARSPEGSRPGGPSDGGDESPGASGVTSRLRRPGVLAARRSELLDHIWFVRRVLRNVLRRHCPRWLVVGPSWSSPSESGRSGCPALVCGPVGAARARGAARLTRLCSLVAYDQSAAPASL